MTRRDSVERAGTDPGKVAHAVGIGEREPSRVRARGVFGRLAAWRHDRRERRWEEIASLEGRTMQRRFDEHRTVGDAGSIGNDVGFPS